MRPILKRLRWKPSRNCQPLSLSPLLPWLIPGQIGVMRQLQLLPLLGRLLKLQLLLIKPKSQALIHPLHLWWRAFL